MKVKDFKLKSMLEITKAINADATTDELLRLFKLAAVEELGIDKLVLFSFDQSWKCILKIGVEEEVFDQLPRIASVFGLIGELSREEGLRSKASDGYIISEEKLLSRKQGLSKALEKLQTIDQAKIQSGVAGRFTNDHFEETKILWGQFYFLKGKKPDLDFSGAVDYLKRVIEDPEFKLQMEGVGADALVAIESHITLARDQDAMLRDAEHRISLGDFDLARSVEQIPKAERYANPLFAGNHSRLVQLDAYKECFFNQIAFSEIHKRDLYKLLQRTNRAWEKLKIGKIPKAVAFEISPKPTYIANMLFLFS